MIRFKLLLALLFCNFASTGIAQNVFYGERTLNSEKPALCFDKTGFPYPDYFISDSSMHAAQGSLFTWFLQNPGDFIAISARYELFPEKIDKQTIYQLRDSIEAVNAAKIDLLTGDSGRVVFYIHGFRKSFKPQNADVTSVEEFKLLEQNFAVYGQPAAAEVEVYWDGLYDCCFSIRQKRNRELYRLFEVASANAVLAGMGLRTTLNRVKAENIGIVAHSLGSKVAHSCLFNYTDSGIPTPSHKTIRAVYLAPAMDSDEFEGMFQQRNSYENDNYHFLVVYNENDFVLRKKDPKIGWFGPGTTRYGNTSLGCNRRDAAVKMAEAIKKAHPAADVQLLDKTAMGKVHSLRYYATGQNLEEVSEYLRK